MLLSKSCCLNTQCVDIVLCVPSLSTGPVMELRRIERHRGLRAILRRRFAGSKLGRAVRTADWACTKPLARRQGARRGHSQPTQCSISSEFISCRLPRHPILTREIRVRIRVEATGYGLDDHLPQPGMSECAASRREHARPEGPLRPLRQELPRSQHDRRAPTQAAGRGSQHHHRVKRFSSQSDKHRCPSMDLFRALRDYGVIAPSRESVSLPLTLHCFVRFA